MRKHHQKELERMIAADLGGKLNDIAYGGRNGGELATLNYACYDPRLFPVHVLADSTVVKLIKKVQRGTVTSMWAHAARNIWQLLS